MSRLKTLLNNRIKSGDFTWDTKYDTAYWYTRRTNSVYTTSQSRIALCLPLMKQIQWIHQHVKTKHL